MCRILVTYSSRMGGTREIAEAIADELTETDHTVTCAPCDEAPDADTFDAVVIGSALYVRRWRRDALHYLRRQAPPLATRPTYLFQSGPAGNDPEPRPPTATPRAVRHL